MRVRCLEIRWHDGLPIYAIDFQPLPVAQLRKLLAPRITRDPASALPSPNVNDTAQVVPATFRMATSGGDKVVRVWMVHPNILPPSATAASTSENIIPYPPRVEYLATLAKHTATVNVVRFSPSGEFIASAGDDGMIAVWNRSDRPTVTYGSDVASDEAQFGKEYWRVRVVLRCTTREVYDLAWSPNSEYIVSGSTDNTARIFNAVDGTCLREITEHSHYVQGVAWDPLNEFIATQSSDRSVHVYAINTKRGTFETHAIGKNSRMHLKHSRTSSSSNAPTPIPQLQSIRPGFIRQGSAFSEADSVMTSASERRDDTSHAGFAAAVASTSGDQQPNLLLDTSLRAPLTPSASVISSSSMFPPGGVPSSATRSRRSSFSSQANAPSPAVSSRGNFGRSPSPMPPLPAIRTPIATPAWASVKLYGDEGFTNFFRRLAFSPDGGLLLTPAGQFDDPSAAVGSRPSSNTRAATLPDDPPVLPRKVGGDPSVPSSSVYIYSRANFARPPVAHLPGHKTASIAVRFSPVLYELRSNVGLPGSSSQSKAGVSDTKRVIIEKGKDLEVALDLGEIYTLAKPSSTVGIQTPAEAGGSPQQVRPPPSPSPSTSSLRAPSAQPNGTSLTPIAQTASVFALPYRMLFAVATQDTVMVYDTQQAGPICLFTNLHYAAFTDVAWAPDGQSLMLASSDGYCSIVIFDEFLPVYHTQQHNIQLQALASSVSTPQTSHVALPTWTGADTSDPGPSLKRSEPASSADDEPPNAPLISLATEDSSGTAGPTSTDTGPKKKKRRIAPTHLGKH